MKKLVCYFILFNIFCLSSKSQVILNYSDISFTNGYLYVNNSSDYIAPGDTGKNVNWDLSNLLQKKETPNEISISEFDSSFLNSNFAIVSMSNDKTVRYFLEDSLVRWELGSNSNNLFFKYNIPYSNITFPIEYLMTDTQDFSATYYLNNIENFRKGKSIKVYDGYGSVTTPFKTFNNVIRRTETLTYKDSQSGFEVNSKLIITTWWAKGYCLPVATLTSGESSLGGEIYSASFLSEPPNSIKQQFLNFDIAVHPNPVSHTLNVSTNWSSYEITLSNVLGQIVHKENSSMIFVGDFESVFYLLTVRNLDTKEVRLKKIIVEK